MRPAATRKGHRSSKGGGASRLRRPSAFPGAAGAAGVPGAAGAVCVPAQFSQILKARTVYGDRGVQVPPPGYVSNSPVSAHSADW